MCALPRVTRVTTVYQRDSSSKRPRASVVSAARSPTRRRTTWRTRRPGLRAQRAAPSAPLDAAPTTWSDAIREQAGACSATAKPRSKDRGLTKGHSISVYCQTVSMPRSAVFSGTGIQSMAVTPRSR